MKRSPKFPLVEVDPYEGNEFIEASRKIQGGWQPNKYDLYANGWLHPFGNVMTNRKIIKTVLLMIALYLVGLAIIL